MTEFIKSWLLGVTCAAMVLALAESLAPEGGVKRVCRLAGGLVLLLAAISPVVKLDVADISRITEDYRTAAEEYSQALEETNEFLYESIIAENASAYILDKAGALGMNCTVSVNIAHDQVGTPYPDSVTVCGVWTREQRDELSRILENELGIPAQRQRFEETQP